MSLSIEALRREVGEHRDALVRRERQADQQRSRIEALEQEIETERGVLEGVRAQITYERRVIEALQAAAAVLGERLPAPRVETRREPTPVALPAEVIDQPQEDAERRRAIAYVLQRAEELDMASVSPVMLDRADTLAMLLVDYGPMRQHRLVELIAENRLFERVNGEGEVAHGSLDSFVSMLMPILVRQGRVQPVEADRTRFVTWAAVPAEQASAGLGVPLDNYEGRTTRWPEGGQAPAAGAHVSVESQAFEQGKKR